MSEQDIVKNILDHEDEILRIYADPIFYRISKSDLDVLRSMCNEKFLKVVEDVGGWLALSYVGGSVSVADCEWQALVEWEMSRRSILSPEFTKQKDELMERLNKMIEETYAQSKNYLNNDDLCYLG